MFQLELDCLRPLLAEAVHPWLEVGVGSGRFAQALGVDVGVDPALAPLQIARGRGIRGIRANGEKMPFSSGHFGAALIVVTLCFTATPRLLLAETHRVLGGGGVLIIGTIPRDSAWGSWYRAKGEAGNPFYRQAHFLTVAQLLNLLDEVGFQVGAARSTLTQPPGDALQPEAAQEGIIAGAGFLALQAWRSG